MQFLLSPFFFGALLLPHCLQKEAFSLQKKDEKLLFHLALSAKRSPEGPLKGWKADQALHALETWFRKRQYPLPADPDAIVALPANPLLLDGVPDLLRVVDLLRLQNPGDRLPIRVEPGLALGTSWARKRPWFSDGSWWFEDLLPESPLPRGMKVRPVPRGILLARANAPASLAEYFAKTFLLFIQPSLRTEVRVRAAIELASLQIPNWEDNLKLIAPNRPDLNNAVQLCRAVSFALGGKIPNLSQQVSSWYRLFAQTQGDAAFYLGLALRRSLMLGKGLEQIKVTDEAWATILAGVRPGRLKAELSRSVIAGLPPRVETSLVLCLARGEGVLSKELTKMGIARCFSKNRVPFGKGGNRRVAAWLFLLFQRNPEALQKEMPRFEPWVCGGDLRRGRLMGRNFSQLGKKHSLRIMEQLSHRKTLEAGDLGLLAAFDSFGVPGLGLTLPEIMKAFKTGKASPVGRVLLDLGIGEIRHPSPPTREIQLYLQKAFDRLLQYQSSPLQKTEGWSQALGKALGQCLLLLPRGPSGRPASQWLATWVQDPKLREAGMKAFGIGIKRRSSLFRDSLAQIDQVKVGRIQALRILGRWNRLALQNPLPSGSSLWFPLDPLLGNHKLEFDLPLFRR